MKSVTNPLRAAILAIVIGSCSTGLPFDGELNLAFQTDRNQLVLDRLRIDGQAGRFVAGSAHDQTLVDAGFAARHGLAPGMSAVMIQPGTFDRVQIDLADFSGEIDAIVGRELLGPVLTIDYENGLLTRFSSNPHTVPGRPHRWQNMPGYPLTINDVEAIGVIDTTVPDTLLVPRSMLGDVDCQRCPIDVMIAGIRFDDVDARVTDGETVRIGNRILQHFLIVIDYRARTATLAER